MHFGPGFSIHAPYGGTLRVGQAVEFRRGFRLELAEGYSEVSIGAGTAFTYEVVIQCGRRIEIGERCIFGQATMIVDGDHRFRDLDRPIAEQGYDLRPVTIADDVWAAIQVHDHGRRRARARWSARTPWSRATCRRTWSRWALRRGRSTTSARREASRNGLSASASSQAARKSGASS